MLGIDTRPSQNIRRRATFARFPGKQRQGCDFGGAVFAGEARRITPAAYMISRHNWRSPLTYRDRTPQELRDKCNDGADKADVIFSLWK